MAETRIVRTLNWIMVLFSVKVLPEGIVLAKTQRMKHRSPWY